MILDDNDLINKNIDISSYGYKKLFSLYLENKDIVSRQYIFSNIKKVTSINKDDIFEVIKYCALYNRSYYQIKYSNDHKLFNGDYLNTLKLLIEVFKEKLVTYDNKQDYIYFEDEFDYFDLIILYLKEIKNYDELYTVIYNVFSETVFNDIKVFYKLVYTLLTNSYFNSMKCRIIYEVFHLKDILFDYLKRNNNIENVILEVNKLFVHVPTITSSNLDKLIELISIREVCCDKSLTFFSDGVKMLKFYNSNNFFDYSAVSLQFFKVIEIELKEKVIKYCSHDLHLESLYQGIIESDDLSKFRIDFISKLELGKMRYILRNVKSLMYDIRKEINVSYYNKEVEIFYTRLISLFMNVKNINFYLDILHNNCVDLYRNSAVHTGIVSYERAQEALIITKLFLNNVKKLNYNFNISNSLNIDEIIMPNFIIELINKK